MSFNFQVRAVSARIFFILYLLFSGTLKQIRTYLLCWLLFSMHVLQAQKPQLPLNSALITSVPLYSPLQKDSAFIRWDAEKALHLFIFLSPDCPLCHNYAPLINQLYSQYHQQIQVYSIIPGRSYADSLVQQFAETFSAHYPILKDSHQVLTKYFKASKTPEVFLLNNTGEILYQGAIDDWAVALGKKRIKTTKHYLKDAIENGLKGFPITTAYVPAVGCIINEY